MKPARDIMTFKPGFSELPRDGGTMLGNVRKALASKKSFSKNMRPQASKGMVGDAATNEFFNEFFSRMAIRNGIGGHHGTVSGLL